DNRKTDWVVRDGVMESTKGAGYVATKQAFGDCQLHVEWAAPTKIEGEGQGRGNSGVFLMGVAEVQVLDNFNNPTYPDGTAGALYGVMPPMANALRGPGEWQSYDIVFRRPIVVDGKVVDEGSMTVFVNGVLVQDATPLEGGGGYRTRTQPKGFGDAAPLQLQDHGNPVRYRNIWYREIRKRPVDGGTDGRLSKEATMAKRAQIAADILKDAGKLQGNDRMLRELESLCYQANEEVLKGVATSADAFLKDLAAAPDKLASRQNEVVKVYRAFQYMVDHKLIDAQLPAYKGLNQLMTDQGWKKK
ncbi:MAG TPA: family 16 glycoside hydrolase, partial [Luteolibacter sp.]|nr:family 16 glycoside hydrolase [Luteolibacter sp.]